MGNFGSMSVAVSGMNAARTGLNVVGHNLANSTAPGYSRQRVLQHDFSYINSVSASRANINTMRGGVNGMQRGLGTDVSSINQIRDMFIDISYRREIGRLGFHTPVADTGLEIELLLSELQGAMPTQTVFDDIWNALNHLSTNQPGLDSRGIFISTASTFINKLNSVHTHLREYQQNLNSQVQNTVIRINQLLEQIAQLNARIAGEENHSRNEDRLFFGDNANDLRDRRNNAMDELSILLEVSFREDANGNIEIRSGNNILLSGGSDINRLGLKQSAPGTNFVIPVVTNSRGILPYDTPFNEYRPLFSLNQTISALNGNDSGRLLGLIVARGLSGEDSYSPERLQALQDAAVDLLSTLTAAQLAYDNALNDYNTQVGLGLGPGDPAYDSALLVLNNATQDLNNARINREANLNAQERIRFNTEQAMIPRMMMHLDTLFNHVVTMLNDAISPKTQPRVLNTTSNEYEYAWVLANGAQVWFEANDPAIPADARRLYIRDDANMPFDNSTTPEQNFHPLFVRNYSNGIHLPRFEESLTTITGPNGESIQVHRYVEPEPLTWQSAGSLYTIGNVFVNPEFLHTDGWTRLPLSLSGAQDDTTLVNRIMTEWQRATVVFPGLEHNPMSITAAYTHMVTTNANATDESVGFVREQTTLVQFIDNKRQSIMGVSMDEELQFMLVFQHAYNANARMVNMLDSMIETILNIRPR